ncbi:MAG: preprotein translocase subunit SecG [Alphaproteobacteria bacterium 13_1_20CM_3_64_12]|nr:MAG: preprotein translocase subunit SecG [Alphaproteobacteria bacterium 13_1_20CM_3_64_12]
MLMNFWQLPVPKVVVAAALIGFVLLQHGKGADMGAAFGSGSSGSLFGAAGSANFLSRTTAILATIFFLSSLGLTYLASNRGAIGPGDVMKQGVMQNAPKAPEPATKAAEVPVGAAPAVQPSAPVPAKDSSKAADVPK